MAKSAPQSNRVHCVFYGWQTAFPFKQRHTHYQVYYAQIGDSQIQALRISLLELANDIGIQW